MSYEDAFVEADAAGKTKKVSVQIVSWEDPGQQVTGVVLEMVPFESSKFPEKCQSYVLDTDAGPVTFVLGKATDDRIAGRIHEGSLVRITYGGKKKLDGGRSCNLFNVEVVEAGDAEGMGKGA